MDRALVMSIAPMTFLTLRPTRYRGDDQAVALEELRLTDRENILRTYELLGSLDVACTLGESHVDAFITASYAELFAAVRTLSQPSAYSGPAASAIHDLRGGAIAALLLELNFDSASRSPLPLLAASVRDCMKLIRTLVQPLDPSARERDLELMPHSLQELASALGSYRALATEGVATVHLHHDDAAVVASSCTELATIERATFNLFDNAARYGLEQQIEAWLVVVGQQHLRVAVVNAIADEQLEHLAVLAATPIRLYEAFSTSGSGQGLQTVAALVQSAYGVVDTTRLVDKGYVGWTIVDKSFVTWFHWPLSC